MHIFRLPFGTDAQVDFAHERGREIELNWCCVEAREKHRGAFGKVMHRLINDQTGAADVAYASVVVAVILSRVNHGVIMVTFATLGGNFPDHRLHFVSSLADADQQTPQGAVANDQLGRSEIFHPPQGVTGGGSECH